MASTFDIGDVVREHGKFSTSTAAADLGNFKDPGLVTFKQLNPDGGTVSDTIATGTTSSTGVLVRLDTGEFYVDITTTGAGLYQWRYTSTGAVATSEEDWFIARSRRVS